jgi:hypothetical protein
MKDVKLTTSADGKRCQKPEIKRASLNDVIVESKEVTGEDCQEIKFQGLTRPTCQYRLENVVSLTKDKTTSIFTFSNEELELKKEEMNTNEEKDLKEVECPGKFKRTDKDMNKTDQKTTEVTVGRKTSERSFKTEHEWSISGSSSNHTSEITSYSGLTPPACTLQIEAATSVSKISGTSELLFESPEHPARATEETEEESSEPLGPVQCVGTFKHIDEQYDTPRQKEIEETVQMISIISTKIGRKKNMLGTLKPPKCTRKIEAVTSVSKISGTSELLFESPEHPARATEETEEESSEPLGPVQCVGSFKRVDGQIFSTQELTREVTVRNVTVNATRIGQKVHFNLGLAPPACTLQIEAATSVSKISGTSELLFESPEHPARATEETEEESSEPLGPVQCVGTFKRVDGQIFSTQELTREVTLRNFTSERSFKTEHEWSISGSSSNHTSEITSYSGLTPPACTLQIEAATSVSKINGTSELLFESPEHPARATEETEEESSEPLGPVQCVGTFKRVDGQIFSTQELTREVTLRNFTSERSFKTEHEWSISGSSSNHTSEITSYSGLTPPACTLQIEAATSVSKISGTSELLFESPEHPARATEETEEESSEPLGPVQCVGTFKRVDGQIFSTQELTREVTLRNFTSERSFKTEHEWSISGSSSNHTSEITSYSGLTPPACTLQIEAATSVSKISGTSELLFESPEHPARATEETEEESSEPLGPVQCVGTFKRVDGQIFSTQELTREVTLRNFTSERSFKTEHEWSISGSSSNHTSEITSYSGLTPPACTLQIEAATSVSKINGTSELLFESPEHPARATEETEEESSEPLGPVQCVGTFKHIDEQYDTPRQKEIEETVQMISIISTKIGRKKNMLGTLKPPKCTIKIEAVTSVSKISGTSELLFESPEHPARATKETEEESSEPLGPVQCVGSFKRVDGQIFSTQELTREVTVRNVTVNATRIGQKVHFNLGLAPPACTLQIEAATSVSKISGTSELLFESPEHPARATEETEEESSEPLQTDRCRGSFKPILNRYITSEELTREVTVRNVTVNATRIGQKISTNPRLAPPACTLQIEAATSVSKINGTSELLFESPEHPARATEETEEESSEPLGPVQCVGTFKRVDGQIFSTQELTREVTLRNFTSERSFKTEHEWSISGSSSNHTSEITSYSGLTPPACTLQIEAATSVSKISGTSELLFESPEHPARATEETEEESSEPLGPVQCVGSFKRVDGQIFSTQELTREVTVRNVTVNATRIGQKVHFNLGLAPPACTLQIEAATSVSKISGTSELLFESPEHPARATEETEEESSEPLQTDRCRGSFKPILNRYITSEELTREVTVRNVTVNATRIGQKISTNPRLAPPACTLQIEAATSVSKINGTSELLFESPEHPARATEETEEESSEPLGPVQCVGTFKRVDGQIFSTQELTREVTLRNFTSERSFKTEHEWSISGSSSNHTSEITSYSGLTPPACTLQIEAATSVSKISGTSELLFESPEHPARATEETEEESSEPLGPVQCVGTFKRVDGQIFSTQELTREVTVRNVTVNATRIGQKVHFNLGLAPPACTLQIEAATSVSKISGTSELLFESPEHPARATEETEEESSEPLQTDRCRGSFKPILNRYITSEELTREVTVRNVTVNATRIGQKISTNPRLAPPACTLQIEAATSVSKINGTSELLFESPEHPARATEETEEESSEPLGPVQCVSSFKRVDGQIFSTQELTREVTVRNVTVNATRIGQKVHFNLGLAPPACTLQIEAATSVSKISGTSELLFESPEHPARATEETEEESSEPLQTDRCRGSFKPILNRYITSEELTREVTVRNVTVNATRIGQKISTNPRLAPPACTLQIEAATSVSKISGTSELLFESPEHPARATEETEEESSEPLGPVQCVGTFKRVDGQIFSTQELTREVTVRNVTVNATRIGQKISSNPRLVPPACTLQIEAATSVSKISGTSELLFESPEHPARATEETEEESSEPLGPVQCVGTFKPVDGQIFSTQELTREVTVRNVTVNATRIGQKVHFNLGLAPPACTLQIEAATSVSKISGTSELLFESPEQSVQSFEVSVDVSSEPLSPVDCLGKFLLIQGFTYQTSEITRMVYRNITTNSTSVSQKIFSYSGLVVPACSSQIEAVTSVSQISDSSAFVYSSTEHQIKIDEETTPETSVPLGPAECLGGFAAINDALILTEETFTLSSKWRPLAPAVCESTLPGIAWFVYEPTSDVITISAVNHVDITIINLKDAPAPASVPKTGEASAPVQAHNQIAYNEEATDYRTESSSEESEDDGSVASDQDDDCCNVKLVPAKPTKPSDMN